MKVSIELMSMHSDPGYIPSFGYQEAVLVAASAVVDCGGDEDSLFDLDGDSISVEMLTDISCENYRSGACRYHLVKGVYDVPEGMVVVQKRYVHISTRDSSEEGAFVVNCSSLKQLYLERADYYWRLAADCAV